MNIRLPFVYEANVVMNRQRNPRSVWFLDTVEVSVPEVDVSSAPAFMTWDAANAKDELEPREIRMFDGHFLLKAGKLPGVSVTASDLQEQSVQSISAVLEVLGINIHADGPCESMRSYFSGTAPRPKPSDIKTVIESQEDRYRADAREAGQGLVSIEGQIWYRVKEPVIAVVREKRDDNKTVHIMGVHTGSKSYREPIHVDSDSVIGPPIASMLFALDDYESAIDFLRGAGSPYFNEFASPPVVHIPSAVTFDPSFDIALRTVQYAVEEFIETIGGHPRGCVETWFPIRDTYYAYQRTGDRSLISHAVDELLPAFLTTSTELEEEKFGVIRASVEKLEDTTITVPSLTLAI